MVRRHISIGGARPKSTGQMIQGLREQQEQSNLNGCPHKKGRHTLHSRSNQSVATYECNVTLAHASAGRFCAAAKAPNATAHIPTSSGVLVESVTA